MDDARTMGVREALAHHQRDLELPRDSHAIAFAHAQLEVAADQVLHGQERRAVLFAKVEDGDDVAMRELRRGARFAEEAFALLWLAVELGGDDFDRDDARQQGIERSVDGPHSALTQALGDFVASDAVHRGLKVCNQWRLLGHSC